MKQILDKRVICLTLIFFVAVSACTKRPDPLPIRFIEDKFETGNDDWAGDFAFYKKDQDAAVGFALKQELLPQDLKSVFHGLKIQGNNSGDSLFIFIKKKISDLDPAKTYKVAYEVDLVTNFPDTTNASGRQIYFKAGASTQEPKKTLNTSNVYSVSIKNGAVAKNGTEMLLLGNTGNGIDSTAYKAITRSNANLAVEVKPNAAGEIWLCAGFNTKYKGQLTLYFDRIYVAVGEKPEVVK